MSTEIVPQRTCTKCNQTFPATTEFFYAYKNKSGLTARCKECIKAASHEYANANAEVIRAKRKEYTAAHAEENRRRASAWAKAHPDRRHEYMVQYYVEHKEELSRANVERAKNNPEQTKARIARWVEANPDRKREISRQSRSRRYPVRKAAGLIVRNKAADKKHKAKYRAMLHDAEGSFTEAELYELYEAQNHRCYYCGITLYWDIPGDIHADHYVPLSRGGGNAIIDMVLACQDCNLSKADKLYLEWVAVRGW